MSFPFDLILNALRGEKEAFLVPGFAAGYLFYIDQLPLIWTLVVILLSGVGFREYDHRKRLQDNGGDRESEQDPFPESVQLALGSLLLLIYPAILYKYITLVRWNDRQSDPIFYSILLILVVMNGLVFWAAIGPPKSSKSAQMRRRLASNMVEIREELAELRERFRS
jgi:hypothetical protein